jgi:(2Fe-2S) ferredoxin
MEKVFDIHLFVCTNQRQGNERKSCGETHGMELVTAFKKNIVDKNLPLKIRAQRAGCLGICDYGPTIAIYPEGVFYVGVRLEDVDEIVNEHLVNGKPVKRLLLKSDSDV